MGEGDFAWSESQDIFSSWTSGQLTLLPPSGAVIGHTGWDSGWEANTALPSEGRLLYGGLSTLEGRTEREAVFLLAWST